MIKKVANVVHPWFFPIGFGLIYWTFDSLTSLINPVSKPETVMAAFFPPVYSLECLFRMGMLLVCMFGGKLFERTVARLQAVKKQLYLSDYAVENTRAFQLFWTNEKGEFIKVNKYAAERLGYTKQELLSMKVFDVSMNITPALWAELRETLKKKGSISYLSKHRRKDGTPIDVLIYLQYLKTFGDEYEFAFVCDAMRCPLTEAESQTTPCGRPALPSLPELLGKK